MNALVIDDSKPIRTVLKDQLRKLGFEVDEAENGLQGLDRLKKNGNIDLVLVDWNMPEMDGISFVRAVRADATYAELPLMMITTNVELSEVSRALEAGVNEYIMKPFTVDILKEKLELLGFSQD
jgi:two-component system chemotaxis response regulator CheY